MASGYKEDPNLIDKTINEPVNKTKDPMEEIRRRGEYKDGILHVSSMDISTALQEAGFKKTV